MFWPGTVLGLVAGWALASIPGALLGALLGQVLDRRLKERSWRGLLALAIGWALATTALAWLARRVSTSSRTTASSRPARGHAA